MNSVQAQMQTFWKGLGRWGQERGLKVTLWPSIREGAVALQFGAEKRTLIQTESVTLPPIHRVVLVDHKSGTEKPSRPHRGWSCTETVPLCTNARQQRQQTFATPLHHTQLGDKETTAHFTSLIHAAVVCVLFGFFDSKTLA